MSLHIGSNNIVDIRRGSTKIAKVYHGSDLVWGYIPGQVLFESSTAQTTTLYVKCRCKLSFILVGGGGGGARAAGSSQQLGNQNACAGGGSGAYVYGTKEFTAGTYTIVVGAVGETQNYGSFRSGTAPSGGNSSFGGQIANGGSGGYVTGGLGANAATAGTGGEAVYSSGLNGINGNKGTEKAYSGYDTGAGIGGTSVYGGYGKGGNSDANGTNGYVKIVAV